jgi:1-deoxy-D-xylulose-5-phosphate reductoisomerase
MNTFKCLAYAYDALRLGGSYPIALNGANEELVAMYLNRKISFLDIQNTIGEVLDKHNSIEPTSVEEILAVDRESRLMVRRIIGE